ncbi:DUF2163 domain-containing protein [Ruegeria sp. Ofav3-42]|uniref:baseplate hub domain-containing protein n=1 Tax=Ruegeria sp. Ofav3-42 TaxID=2917759 RepID=UPI001EF70929|nr:DUF2163 domain-containing protein [Ruegeria sp. Ofav3-42]MCG7520845.1 DUF2163 domain-containing protein [Ruegeria sp. Ofav3-42]
MSYADFLSRVSGKRPYWLYRVQLGSEVAFMTTLDGGYTDPSSQVWAHTKGVKHSRIKQTQRISSANLELRFPSNHTFARKFLEPRGVQQTSVQIFHGYANDPDQERATKFRGRVVSVNASRTEITFKCEDIFTAFRRNGLSTVMQRPCRHALYKEGCGLNIADFNVPATVSAVSGVALTVPVASDQANGWYSYGLLTFNGNEQMITGHSGSSLTLLAPLPGLAEEIAANGSASVSIARGCNLLRQTCNDKFNNLLSHGGFHAMGGTPFDGRSIA